MSMPKPSNPPSPPANEPGAQLFRLTRRSFATGAAGALAATIGWRWLTTREDDDHIPAPLRRVLEFNERVSRAIFSEDRLAPEFPRDQAEDLRTNGTVGLAPDFDPGKCPLLVFTNRHDRPRPITLAELKSLPRVDMVTEFKCVEGWSTKVHWAGVRLRDFAAKYGFASHAGEPYDPARKPSDLYEYVGLETPNECERTGSMMAHYYVGHDMASALHPQTLLAYEMNGETLTLSHGAPVRLVSTVKYGYKMIKRIETIRFTDRRPRDYWAERGYDWYGGH